MKHEPISRVPATLFSRKVRSEREETLADETPVALVYNGRSYAVMMATPADLDDFAYGFTLSEGIVAQAEQIEIVDRLHTEHGISLQMLIPQRHAEALRERDRNLTGRTGCGLCGAASLEAAIRPVRKVAPAPEIRAGVLLQALHQLTRSQPLNERSGAVHAAGLLFEQDQLLVREDVGRHNAVDKVIGASVFVPETPRALLVTSRASYEIVHKAASIGIALVAAISAPTALAVRIAQEAGITLVGFARADRMTVYTGQGVLD